jgi:hypothetical protein
MVMRKRRYENNRTVDEYSADYRGNSQDVVKSLSNDKETEATYKSDYREYPPVKNNFEPQGEMIVKRPTAIFPSIANTEEYEYSEEYKHKPSSLKRAFIGAVLLIAIFAGVCYLVSLVENEVSILANKQLENTSSLSLFITPMVMQDPKDFNEINECDMDTINCAALFRVISMPDAKNNTNYDSNGQSLIPKNEVKLSAIALFGEKVQFKPQTPADKTFYVYDGQDDMYHVSMYTNVNSFVPRILDKKIIEGGVSIKVMYISPDDPYRKSPDENPNPTPAKYVEYELKDAKTEQSYYINAVHTLSI